MCVKEKALTIKDLKLDIKRLKLLKEWIHSMYNTYTLYIQPFEIPTLPQTHGTEVCIAFEYRATCVLCTSKYVNACTEPENLCRGHYHSCLHDSCLQAGCWSCRGGLRCSCHSWLVEPPPDRLPLEINNIPRWAKLIDFVIELNPFCFGLSAFYLPTPDYARRLNITPPLLDTKHVLL